MAHYRLTAIGTLPGESFNFGMHVEGTAGDAAGAEAAWSAALTSMWTDVTDGIETLISSTTEIVAGHAAELDPLTGKQIDASQSTLTLVGTNVGQTLPNEVACAVTTRGAKPVRKQRGRFYLPPFAVGELTAGRFATAAMTRVVNAAAILVNSLQAAGFTPEIYHPDHTGSPIVEVDVGDVPDAQRRRRDKLVEVRQSLGV